MMRSGVLPPVPRLLARILLLAGLGLAPWAGATEAAGRPGHAAIASAHHLATDAGFEVLAKGGNAFDAAVAVSAALAVVENSSSGIGGGGFWLLHRASDGKRVFIDGRETAPAAVRSSDYLDANGQLDRDRSINGALAAGIPGEPAALVLIAEQYGRVPLAVSLAPAIRLARDGFPLEQRLAGMIAMRREVLQRYPASRKVYLHKGEVPKLGSKIRQPDLAATLQALADRGFDGFYRGRVASALVKGVRAAGGNWSLDDLSHYRAIEREPLSFRYRGSEIVSAPPPSSGGVILATIFNIIEGYDFPALDRVGRVHLLVEAMRRAYRDRSFILGDPDQVAMPIDLLTSKAYAAGLRAAIRMDKATPSAALPEGPAVVGGTDTTHFSIIDADGNLVAGTASVNLPMGSGLIVPGTGVLLNNEMDDFALAPNQANAYGLIGTDANAPQPGKRMLSTMTPTLVFRDDRVLVIGTPGGSRIATMVALGLAGFFDGAAAESIVAAPRFHHQYLPDVISFEAGALADAELARLQKLGHKVEVAPRTWGNMNLVIWDRVQNRLHAASDPRGLVGKGMVR